MNAGVFRRGADLLSPGGVRGEKAQQDSAPPPSAWRRVIIALIVILTIAYYFWTSLCSFNEVLPIRPGGEPETDHFNLLSHAFLEGRLHLGEAPRALLEVANPYDPQSRGNIEVLHDASFYDGKYYIYFGPAPVVSLFLPFRVLTGRDLPLPYGVWLFVSGAYLALASIFLTVQRRYFPTASVWSVAAGLVAMGAGTMVVSLLRRPNVWELATSSGLFYFAGAMVCLVRALHSKRATGWALAGGLALGMAVASRPTYILCSVVFVIPLLVRGYSWRELLAAAGGCGVIVFGLFVYNYARFEDPFEFGQKYQLSSIIEGNARHFSLSYVAFNLRVYFLSALRWAPTFPFHEGVAVPPQPAGFGGYEYSIGMLPNLPFAWFGLAAFMALAVGWRRAELAPALRAIVASVMAATLVITALLLCYFGSCVRYMADFTPWFMLLAGCGLLSWEATLRSAWGRGALHFAGTGLALFSAAAAGLAVVNLYNLAPETPAPGYARVERALNYPAYLWQHYRWPDDQATEIVLSFPADRTPRQEVLLTLNRGARRTGDVFVEFLENNTVRFGYREAARGVVLLSPTVTVGAGEQHALRVSINGRPSDYNGHRFRLRAQFDDRPLWDAKVVSLRAFPAQLAVGSDGSARFTGRIHRTRPISDADFARPTLGGVRLRVAFTPGMAGRSFPLVTSGRPETGDFLFVSVKSNGRIAFGYDHWGLRGVFSPELEIKWNEPRVIECWLPAVFPDAVKSDGQAALTVKLDGAIVWQQLAAGYDTTPDTFYAGRNPIGGSSCEAAFENVIVEDTQLAPP